MTKSLYKIRRYSLPQDPNLMARIHDADKELYDQAMFFEKLARNHRAIVAKQNGDVAKNRGGK